MSAPGFLIVHQHVARNPVARAIAIQRTRAAVRDFQTRLYMLAEGEQVEADGVAAAQVLYAAYVALDQAGRASEPAARVIHGAISALQQLALRRWAWRGIDAAAIDQALIHASHVLTTYPARAVQRAWADLHKVDALTLADDYAKACANARCESIYGTSQSFTDQCIAHATTLREQLTAALAALAALSAAPAALEKTPNESLVAWVHVYRDGGSTAFFKPEHRAEMLRALDAAPAGEPVAPIEKPYFAHDQDAGAIFFATQAEALKYAADTLEWYRREARHDGEWSDEPEWIRVGVVAHAAIAIGNEVDGVDYQIAAATAPAPAAGEPVAWTLRSELDARETTCKAHLWFTNPQNSAWAPLYAAPAPAEPAPIPAKPTPAMCQAADKVTLGDKESGEITLSWDEYERLWIAMLAAAPASPKG